MNYICPKCGKKMDLSTEALINNEYKVICPQCLCQLHIVGDYAYIPNDSLELDTTIGQSRTINCPVCGHEANSNAHFCPNCGHSYDDGASSTSFEDITPEDVTVIPPPIPNQDPLYHEALKFLAGCTSITPMMLRDRFHISDERAAELIRQLEASGAIGPYNHGGPRQILIPHRGLYEIPQHQATPQATPQNQPKTQNRSIGCIAWLAIFFLISLLMRTCGG